MSKIYFASVKTQSAYDALIAKDPYTLYFVEDSQRIYKGGIDVSQSVIFVNRFPDAISKEVFEDKLYVNTVTREAKIKSNKTWLTLTPKVIFSIDDINNPENYDAVISAQGIKEYIASEIEDYRKSGSSVTDLKYNPKNGTIIAVKGSTEHLANIKLNNIVHDATFTENDCILSIPIFGKDDIKVDLSRFDRLVSARYDANYHFKDGQIGPAIVLTVSNYGKQDSQIAMDASPFIQNYTAQSSNTIKLSVDKNLVITGNVIISKQKGNALSAKEDGLYVDVSNKADKLPTTAKGHLLIADDEGNLADSGLQVSNSEQIENSDSTLPLSSQVTSAIKKVEEKIKDVSNHSVIGAGEAGKVVISTENGIIRSDKNIGGDTLSDTARSNLLATEEAVHNVFSWQLP